jgi:hypothetical protein
MSLLFSGPDGERMSTQRRRSREEHVRPVKGNVESLDDSMVRIVVKPTWVKLIDFEETLPTAVEELVRRRDERQHA